METAGDRGAPIFLGVDTHSEEHVAVALDGAGRRLGALAVPNDRGGYAPASLGLDAGVRRLGRGRGRGHGQLRGRALALPEAEGTRALEVNREVNCTSHRHRRHTASTTQATPKPPPGLCHGRHRLGRVRGRRRGGRVAARPALRSAVKAGTQAADRPHARCSAPPPSG